MPASDEQLVSSAIAGDESSLTTLLETCGVQIRAALERSYRARLNGEVDLDDVMQVTYFEVFMRIRDFAPAGPGAFQNWVRRIAENNLVDAMRKSDVIDRRRSPAAAPASSQPSFTLAEQAARTRTPSRIAGRDESNRLLDDALQQLPEDYERVLRLYDLEGLGGPEVARHMGRSHGAVKMLVARVRDRLSELLGSGSNFFSSGA